MVPIIYPMFPMQFHNVERNLWPRVYRPTPDSKPPLTAIHRLNATVGHMRLVQFLNFVT